MQALQAKAATFSECVANVFGERPAFTCASPTWNESDTGMHDSKDDNRVLIIRHCRRVTYLGWCAVDTFVSWLVDILQIQSIILFQISLIFPYYAQIVNTSCSLLCFSVLTQHATN